MDGSWTVPKGQNDSYLTNDHFKKKILAKARIRAKIIQAKTNHWRKWRSWRYCQYRQYRHAKIQMRIVRIMRNLTFLNAIFQSQMRLGNETSRLRDEETTKEIEKREPDDLRT